MNIINNASISKYYGETINTSINILNSNAENILLLDNLISKNLNQNNEMLEVSSNINNYYSLLNQKKKECFDLMYPINSIYISKNNNSPNQGNWELINIDAEIDKTDLFNAWFKTKNLTLEFNSDGSIWFLIFNHNSNSGKELFNSHNALCENTTNKMSYLWTLMQNPGIYLSDDKKFEFKLTYPDYSSTGLNHWTQTSNPLQTADYVNNYKAISITWSSNFGGLSRDESGNCLLSGCQNFSNWFYAIGPYSKWSTGCPGPYNSNSVAITGRTQLRIRVFQLEKNNFISSLTKNYYWRRIS